MRLALPRSNRAPILNWVMGVIGGLLVLCGPNAMGADLPDEVVKQEEARIAAIAKGMQSAVCIFANGGNGGGSGAVVTKDGYAVTNYHVVEPAGIYMKCSMADGRLYDAVLVGIDPTGDVALIKLLGREDFVPAVLADSDQVAMGDFCYAVGNPFLLATDFQPTVTMGLVSGTHRYQYPSGTLIEYTDCIQTDASINPGNSGGPLFNMQGEVIGINGRVSFEKRIRVNMGVGYAISSNQVKKFLGCLRGGRIVDHATLGARVATSDEGRVLVADILEDSDAYAKGLRVDDEILAFGGRIIRSTNMYKNILGTYPKGWRVPLTYRQGDKTHDVIVRLGGVHGEEELIQLISREKAPPERPKKKPEEKKEPEGDKPEKKPAPPMPQPGPHGAGQAMPDAVKALIVARHGYANFYFNQLEQSRVWKAATDKQGSFLALGGEWKLNGKTADGTPVEVSLNKDEVRAKLGEEEVRLELSKDLPAQLEAISVMKEPTKNNRSPQERKQIASFAVGLSMWRDLLVRGPEKFGDLNYYGNLEWGKEAELADMLIGTRSVVEGHFVFEPASQGMLSALEVLADVDGEGCTMQFANFQPSGMQQVPQQVSVDQAGQPLWVITWDKVDLQGGTEASEGGKP
ncbi:MAG: S1C family serine protease [Planctomycetaceae bacterium]